MKTHGTVGVLVLARNEEKMLPRCLESVVRDADQIVVVDMASTDGTALIAEKYGARVVPVPILHQFDIARQHGLDSLSTDWVLQLDADEWAPDLLRRVQASDWMRDADALRCPRLNYLGAEPYLRQGWWPNMQVRLFRRSVAHYTATFHRFLHIDGTTASLPPHPALAIHHAGAASAEEMVRNSARYLPRGSTSLPLRDSLKCIGKPLARYITSAAWRDGSDGLAILSAHVLNEIGQRTSDG